MCQNKLPLMYPETTVCKSSVKTVRGWLFPHVFGFYNILCLGEIWGLFLSSAWPKALHPLRSSEKSASSMKLYPSQIHNSSPIQYLWHFQSLTEFNNFSFSKVLHWGQDDGCPAIGPISGGSVNCSALSQSKMPSYDMWFP